MPVRGHLVHLVEPLRLRRHVELTVEVVDGVQSEIRVEADTKDVLVLRAGEHQAHIQVRAAGPVVARRSHVHRVLGSRQAQDVRDGGRGDLTRGHGENRLLGRVFRNREYLARGAGLVGTDDLGDDARAAHDLDGDGARVGVAIHDRTNGVGSGGLRRRGSTRNEASGGINRHASRQSGLHRAAREVRLHGVDVGFFEVGVEGVGRLLEVHASGNGIGADQRLDLVSVQSTGIDSGVKSKAVVAVALGVEVASEQLVGAGSVLGANNVHNAGVRASGGHATLPLEVGGSVAGRSVGEDTNTVDEGTRTLELVGNGLGEIGSGDRSIAPLDEIEHVAHGRDTSASQRRGGSVDEAGAIDDRRSHHSHVRVEVNSGLGAREVKLDGENGVRASSFGSRTDNAVVSERRISAGRSSSGSEDTIGNVLTEHLNAVHVSHDTVAVVHLEFVRGHVRDAHERLAEVLRAGRSHGDGTKRHGLPRAVVEASGVPAVINGGQSGSELPGLRLLDGVVQGKRVGLLSGSSQVVLEHVVSVFTPSGHPGARGPGITIGILQEKGALAVGCRSQTVLDGTGFAVGKNGTRLQDGVPVLNLEGLFVSVTRSALLHHLHVDLGIGASQSIGNADYNNRQGSSHTNKRRQKESSHGSWISKL